MHLRRLELASQCAAVALCVVLAFFGGAGAAAAADSGFGEVAFANSGPAAAQADFELGVAQLHDFEYGLAARSFQRAQAADPKFAMAYWGEAMTYNHPLWEEQDLAAGRRALAKLAPTPQARAALAPTPREKAYLATVESLYGEGSKAERDRRYRDAMAEAHARFPDDVDATCFYALALMGATDAGRQLGPYMRAAALMIEVRRAHPQHPGAAHYLIHATDDPTHAPLGLEAARAYDRIAPEAGHALHMTSHTFLALGLWPDVVSANEAAIALRTRRQLAAGRKPTACSHPETFLLYAELQLGRREAARRILDDCVAQAKDEAPAGGGAIVDPDDRTVGDYMAMRTRYLVDSGDWTGPEAKARLDATGTPLAAFERDWVDAFGLLRNRAARAAADAAVRQADASAEAFLAVLDRSGLAAGHPARLDVAIRMDELHGLAALAEGRVDDGLALLRRAAATEKDKPYEFGPPADGKPAAELLGEVLLERGRTAEARAAFAAALELTLGRAVLLADRDRAS